MKNDQLKYRRLSEPFPSASDGDKALEAFWHDVEVAREAHKIPDVIVVVGLSYMADGDVLEVCTEGQFGDQLRHEALVAATFGRIQADRQAMIARLMAKAVKKGPKEY